MAVWTLPRQTEEPIGPVTVTVSGQAVTDWEATLWPAGAEPPYSGWIAPVAMTGPDGEPGLGLPYTGDREPGQYQLVLRIGTVVLEDVGTVTIT